jgi:hypothetical protein
MFDFANIPSHKHHHPRGMDNALQRGEGKKLGLLDKTGNSQKSKSVDDTDAVDIHSSARRVLNDQILNALKSVLHHPKVPIRDLDPDQFTPEAVADRILNFVANAVENRRAAEGDKAAKDMLAAARGGVEKGFADAKEVLTNLGVYADKVKDDAEKTHELLTQGLNGFDKNLAEGVSLLPGTTNTTVQFALSSESYAERQSTELKIKTRDGDTVTIKVQKAEDYRSSQSAYQDGTTQIFNSEQSYSQSKGLVYSVEGNLDEGELKAVNDLVGEVKELSDNFFNGDTQAAFHHALDIGYDSNEIASFAFNISHTQTSVATQAYAEVREYDTNAQASQLPEKQLNNLLAPVADVMKNLQQLLDHTKELFDKQAPQDDVKNLFDILSLMDESKHPAIDKLEEHAMKPFDQVSQKLFDQLL